MRKNQPWSSREQTIPSCIRTVQSGSYYCITNIHTQYGVHTISPDAVVINLYLLHRGLQCCWEMKCFPTHDRRRPSGTEPSTRLCQRSVRYNDHPTDQSVQHPFLLRSNKAAWLDESVHWCRRTSNGAKRFILAASEDYSLLPIREFCVLLASVFSSRWEHSSIINTRRFPLSLHGINNRGIERNNKSKPN